MPDGITLGETVMNASLRAAVLSFTALGLVACTSTQEKSTYMPPAQVNNSQLAEVENDAEYMAIVERIARRRGITLQWVNPPTKRAVATR